MQVEYLAYGYIINISVGAQVFGLFFLFAFGQGDQGHEKSAPERTVLIETL